MALNWTSKPAGATYRLTWTVPVIDGDSVSSAVLAVSDGDAAIDSYTVDGNDVIAVVSGGTAGTLTTIDASAVTGDGETLTETIYLPIVASDAQTVTARDVCDYALRKIVGVGNDADAAELDDAMESLRGLLARFSIGPVPAAASSEMGLPDDYIQPLKAMLRKVVSDTYEKPLTQTEQQAAIEGERFLLARKISLGELTFSTTLTQPTGTVADLF